MMNWGGSCCQGKCPEHQHTDGQQPHMWPFVTEKEAFWGISYTVNESRKGFPGCFPPWPSWCHCSRLAHREAGGLEQEPGRENQRDDGALRGCLGTTPPPFPATDSPPNVDIHGASQEIVSQMLPFPARVPPSDAN